MMSVDHNKTVSQDHCLPIEITASALPLSCPLPGASVWNLHPKVFLPITDTGKATCPYCGTHYVMTDWHDEGGHHH
jgi:uncharacterized Zn-finger protein